jgi:hypothetical protein
MTDTAEQDLKGKIHGRVVCGNPACRKVLREYEGAENAPGPKDPRYLLFKIEARVIFLDRHGNPIPSIPLWQARQLGADFTFRLGNKAIGYRVVPGTGTLLEDFCSDRCASQFLTSDPEWGLCLRRHVGEIVVFVAHAPNRFKTEQVQTNWP